MSGRHQAGLPEAGAGTATGRLRWVGRESERVRRRLTIDARGSPSLRSGHGRFVFASRRVYVRHRLWLHVDGAQWRVPAAALCGDGPDGGGTTCRGGAEKGSRCTSAKRLAVRRRCAVGLDHSHAGCSRVRWWGPAAPVCEPARVGSAAFAEEAAPTSTSVPSAGWTSSTSAGAGRR